LKKEIVLFFLAVASVIVTAILSFLIFSLSAPDLPIQQADNGFWVWIGIVHIGWTIILFLTLLTIYENRPT
jgi:hypothetical protein